MVQNGVKEENTITILPLLLIHGKHTGDRVDR